MNRKDLVPEFVRDAVGADESPTDARELDTTLVALAETAGQLAPPTALRDRLIAAATSGPTRFAPFFDQLAKFFDLGVDAVVRTLERAESESHWEPGPHPAIRLFHLEAGPAYATADAGLVRMPPSFEWGAHRHSGVERVLILEGGYRESGGRIYRAGDIHQMDPGTDHSFTVLPDAPLLLALVLYGTIEMI